MKITNANLIRLAGLSALMGGLCYVFVGVFHPANVPASVTTTRWQMVHVIACAMSFFAVVGLVGIYVRQAVKAGWLGLVGFIFFGIATFRARILPRGAAVLLALGTVLAPVAAVLSLSAQPKIAIPTGLALAWLGYALMTEHQAPDTRVSNQTAKAAA